MKMYFHCAGLISEEDWDNIYENEKIIVLSDSCNRLNNRQFKKLNTNKHEFSDGSSYWIFYKENGKCLNDDCAFGAYRTI